MRMSPEPKKHADIPKTKEIALAYRYGDGLYINLTSRCPTACKFCIKFSWEYMYRGFNLKLPGEPSVQEIVDFAGDVSRDKEVVFCGYGESTYRLKEMRELTRIFRSKGVPRVRLNTIGLGNLINGRSISPELAEFLDAVSISLNTADPKQYVEINRPLPEFREKAFASAQEFIRECAAHIPETYVTAVEMPGIDVDAVRRLTESLGAKFRLRPHLDDYEEK
jgi:TatD DNase family protein